MPPIFLKGIGEFNARKVLDSRLTNTISMQLGDRNVSFVLENLSQDQLDVVAKSLGKALDEVRGYKGV
jgi:chemotaxis receptor (MCP) glutamine deamidase CheD